MGEMPVLILGAGGHAKVIVDCLKNYKNIPILGMLDRDSRLHGESILGVSVLGDEDILEEKYLPSSIKLVNGIGSVGTASIRRDVFIKFKNVGYDFLQVIHPTAYIAEEVSIGEGVQIITRSVIHPCTYIGNNVIVNTHVSIDHDCYIGDHVHLAPGVVCCGGVTIGQGTHIGSGAVILQGVHVGEDCLIAAGAIVTKDVVAMSKVAGVPARTME